jgi:hypothetical protein
MRATNAIPLGFPPTSNHCRRKLGANTVKALSPPRGGLGPPTGSARPNSRQARRRSSGGGGSRSRTARGVRAMGSDAMVGTYGADTILTALTPEHMRSNINTAVLHTRGAGGGLVQAGGSSTAAKPTLVSLGV